MLKSYLKVVERKDLEKIHEATIDIFENMGIKFESEEALELFRENGAKIEGDIVYISRDMLHKALSTAPSTFMWEGRNPEKSVIIGDLQDTTYVSPCNGMMYIQDLETGKRLPTREDLANVYRLCNHFDIVRLVGAMCVEPSEIPEEYRHSEYIYQLLRNTDKPMIGLAGDREEILNEFKMVEVVMGEGYLKKHRMMGVSVNPLSPLKFDDRGCGTIITYARNNQIVFGLTCALAGITGPVSLIGTAIVQNAELLAALVLSQLANPGTPYIYSPASTVPNYAKGSYVCGTPEANMINIIGIQMAKELYNIPSRSMSGLSDAKIVDCQAAYESQQNFDQLIFAGTNIINNCLGHIDSLMGHSFEQLILDIEMADRALRFMEGADTKPENFSTDVIKKVGHDGTYLTQKSTIKEFRKAWVPLVSETGTYEDWERKGSHDVVYFANKMWKEIIANTPETLLDPETDKKILEFQKEIRSKIKLSNK